MSFDLAAWKESYKAAVSGAFGERIVCAGLQGSRARNEAQPDSDIDAVLILDRLTANDLSLCRKLFQALPGGMQVCGFVSGKSELSCWDAAELVSFYFDTQPLIGDLAFIRPLITRQAAVRAVHTGACSIYHACCHNAVFGNDASSLHVLCKAAFFVLRVKYYVETGEFIQRGADLMPLLPEENRKILQVYIASVSGKTDQMDLLHHTNLLLVWSGNLITEFHVQLFGKS